MKKQYDLIVYVSAGGESTRLYPLTLDLTKGWLDIGNKTPLLLALKNLTEKIPDLQIYVLTQGFTNDIFIPLELRDGTPLGCGKVNYVHFYDPTKQYYQRTTTRGSGEGFINFIERYQEKIKSKNILTMNIDNLANFDVTDMLKYHNEKKSTATIGVTEWNDFDTISQFGTVKFHDESGKILEFKEKSPEPASNYINTGIVMFSPNVLDYLKGKSKELPDLGGCVIPYLLNEKTSMYAYGHKINGYEQIENWVDFGTVESYIMTNGNVLLGKYPWFDYSGYERIGENILVHKRSIVEVQRALKEKRLQLDGYVLIGSNPEFIGRNIINNTIIGHNVILVNSEIKGREENGFLYPAILLDSSGVFDSKIESAILGYSSKVFSNGKRSELKPYSVVGNDIKISSVFLNEGTRIASSRYNEKIIETKRYGIVYYNEYFIFFSYDSYQYNPFK